MVRINSINITDIGPIKSLELKFDPHFNIICGQNGVGKTTILDCMAQSFSLMKGSVKRMANSKEGGWEINVSINNKTRKKTFKVIRFDPKDTSDSSSGFYENSNDIIVFKTQRDIPYKELQSITRDSKKELHDITNEIISGTLSNELKSWFVNRHLWSHVGDSLDENQIKNIKLAKECFSILNSDLSFSKVEADLHEIMLATPYGEILFEYLSSGYKSSLAVLLGLIKEIEFRYKEPSKYIKDFDGIVFIDEIDLHLHPDWQAKIYDALKMILPKAQIFTTTHSPHIIQVAEANEIIPLTFDEEHNIIQNSIINKEYGCQGWTVEEILTDVMGMTETRTAKYQDAIRQFNEALENENREAAEKAFSILDAMLHPENVLRKVLSIQLTGL